MTSALIELAKTLCSNPKNYTSNIDKSCLIEIINKGPTTSKQVTLLFGRYQLCDHTSQEEGGRDIKVFNKCMRNNK